MQDYKLLRSHGIVCSCCRRHRGTPVGDPSLEGRRCRDQHLMATQTESEDGESVRATELGPSHPVDTVDTPIPIRHRSARRHRLGSASFATVANCIFQMTSFQTAIECRHLDMQALEWRGVLAFGFGGVIRRNQQITISRALTRYRVDQAHTQADQLVRVCQGLVDPCISLACLPIRIGLYSPMT